MNPMAPEFSQNFDNVRAAIRWTVRHQPHSFDYSMVYVLSNFFELNGGFLEAETTFRLIVDQLLPDLSIHSSRRTRKFNRSVFEWLLINWPCVNLNGDKVAFRRRKKARSWHCNGYLPLTIWILRALRAESIYHLGMIKSIQGALVKALSLYQQAGELYQEVDDQISFGWALHMQNVILQEYRRV